MAAGWCRWCISLGSPEKQNQWDGHGHGHGYGYRYGYRERLGYKELAHAILEAKKSQNLQLAGWRPREPVKPPSEFAGL